MKIGPRLMKIGNHMDLFTEDWGEIGKDRVFSSVTRPRTRCS